jgi:hypothetical protein
MESIVGRPRPFYRGASPPESCDPNVRSPGPCPGCPAETDCLRLPTCVPALYFLGCGEARLAECGEVAESHRAGADRRHGKFQVPSIPLLAPLSRNDNTHVKIGWRYSLTDLAAATGDNLSVTEVRLVRLEGQLPFSSLARHRPMRQDEIPCLIHVLDHDRHHACQQPSAHVTYCTHILFLCERRDPGF